MMRTVHTESTPQNTSLCRIIKDFSACKIAYMILDNPKKTNPRSDLAKLTHNSKAIHIPNIYIVAVEDDMPVTSGGIQIIFS